MQNVVHSLGQIDLNLLVAFDALMLERNVTRAAERLSVTQPALSHTLKRLRETFEDDLFVRTAEGMVPTERAEELHRAIVPALVMLRLALEGPVAFDPPTAEREFTIGMSDATALLILPRLLSLLQAGAPGIRIVAVQYSPAEALRCVQAGELDFAIGAYPGSPGAGLVEKVLSSAQSYHAVADRHNTMLKDGRMDREAYLGRPHIGVMLPGGTRALIDTALESLGLQRRIILFVPSFSIVPAVVRGTQYIGHCSTRFVRQLMYRDELVLFDPPVPLPFNRLRAIWKRTALPNPAQTWLVNLIARVVAMVEGEG